MDAELEQKLAKIRSSPKLQNQQETRVVLSAVEDTLRDSKSDPTPTAYFAALLSLLDQFVSPTKDQKIVNKEVATAVVYLLDLITPAVPAALLRSKFTQILQKLAVVLTHRESDAPLLKSSIGCLESLLTVQDASGWALPAGSVSPRRAVAGLLSMALDHRPKVRRRALEAITRVLKAPPPSPRLDHPAADLCAESALKTLVEGVEAVKKSKKGAESMPANAPSLMHSLQLVKTVASASGGWPSKKLEALCDALLGVAKSSNEYLTIAAFEIFEVVFSGMVDEASSAKLPHLMDILDQLRPSASDVQLLPPWIAIVSRGWDVYAQVEQDETFHKLPSAFGNISEFLSSPAHNIRVSASECLISFLVNCIPTSVILEPSVYDEKTLEKLARKITDLLNIKYQTAWQEVFQVVASAFENLRWRADPILVPALKAIGDLRTLESFNGKKEADEVIGTAVTAMGPRAVLKVLPLNMGTNSSEAGRAWLLPILRVSVRNTELSHFREELAPASEKMFQKVLGHGEKEKTMEVKIYETVVHQIWSCLPGYCDLPIDLLQSFDQGFAELISNLLYQQTDLRTGLCQALQLLVTSNKAMLTLEDDDKSLELLRVSKQDAKANLQHLAGYSSNLLAVLFNVYTQTLPTYRGPVLQCIDAYLSIIPETDLVETFTRVATMLEESLTKPETNGSSQAKDRMPPMSHTLMDLIVTIAVYLPRASLVSLFNIAFVVLQNDDSNLQKKAYKLIPRLAESEVGQQALQERSGELQNMLLKSADKAQPAARRHRLAAVLELTKTLPPSDLHFIPSVLPEVVLYTKEANEKTRHEAFDLLIAMGTKMHEGGQIQQSKVPNMPADVPPVAASLAEYFTMVSAGLAGSVPHSISATILALTRILHEFHAHLSAEILTELIATVHIFLLNANREIVRSALGFSKVCIVSLPKPLMEPLLKELIPTFLKYSKEHKGHLQARVKHIFERLIGRFGYAAVEKCTPPDDHRLISAIRKRKERAKRKRKEGDEEREDGDDAAVPQSNNRFANEFDNAVYGSSASENDSDSDPSDDDVLGPSQRRRPARSATKGTYIQEPTDDPLDLLSSNALAHISTTRPLPRAAVPVRRKAKTDLDGKLVFDEARSVRGSTQRTADGDGEENDGTAEMDLESGISAYVAAIRGRDAPVRKATSGKLKFSNKRVRGAEDDGDEAEGDVDVEMEGVKGVSRNKRGDGEGKGGKGGRGVKAARMQRRGLGEAKTSRVASGRVGKNARSAAGFKQKPAGNHPARGSAKRAAGRGGR